MIAINPAGLNKNKEKNALQKEFSKLHCFRFLVSFKKPIKISTDFKLDVKEYIKISGMTTICHPYAKGSSVWSAQHSRCVHHTVYLTSHLGGLLDNSNLPCPKGTLSSATPPNPQIAPILLANFPSPVIATPSCHLLNPNCFFNLSGGLVKTVSRPPSLLPSANMLGWARIASTWITPIAWICLPWHLDSVSPTASGQLFQNIKSDHNSPLLKNPKRLPISTWGKSPGLQGHPRKSPRPVPLLLSSLAALTSPPTLPTTLPPLPGVPGTRSGLLLVLPTALNVLLSDSYGTNPSLSSRFAQMSPRLGDATYLILQIPPASCHPSLWPHYPAPLFPFPWYSSLPACCLICLFIVSTVDCFSLRFSLSHTEIIRSVRLGTFFPSLRTSLPKRLWPVAYLVVWAQLRSWRDCTVGHHPFSVWGCCTIYPRSRWPNRTSGSPVFHAVSFPAPWVRSTLVPPGNQAFPLPAWLSPSTRSPKTGPAAVLTHSSRAPLLCLLVCVFTRAATRIILKDTTLNKKRSDDKMHAVWFQCYMKPKTSLLYI